MHSHRLHVLIAEDDPDTTYVMSYLLQEAGHRVTVARTGVEAIALTEAGHPDIAVLDVIMPVLDGISTCERISCMSPRPRIVVLTVLPFHEIAAIANAAGADAVLHKPFACHELLEYVEGFETVV